MAKSKKFDLGTMPPVPPAAPAPASPPPAAAAPAAAPVPPAIEAPAQPAAATPAPPVVPTAPPSAPAVPAAAAAPAASGSVPAAAAELAEDVAIPADPLARIALLKAALARPGRTATRKRERIDVVVAPEVAALGRLISDESGIPLSRLAERGLVLALEQQLRMMPPAAGTT